MNMFDKMSPFGIASCKLDIRELILTSKLQYTYVAIVHGIYIVCDVM